MQPIYTILAEYNYDVTQVFAFTSLKKAIDHLDDLVQYHFDLVYHEDYFNRYYNAYLKIVRDEIRTGIKNDSSFGWAYDGEDETFCFVIQKHE